MLTTLHAGGKFDAGAYQVSGGLHGVGVSVVNALSVRLDAEVRRDGFVWTQSFCPGPLHRPRGQGQAVQDGRVPRSPSGPTPRSSPRPSRSTTNGGIEAARVAPSSTVVSRSSWSTSATTSRRAETFLYRGGLVDFIRHLNITREPLHPHVIDLSDSSEDAELELAMQWTQTYNESVLSFANNINTHEGGTHEEGFRKALTNAINTFARSKNLLKEKDENLIGEDIREGLTAVLSVKVRQPQFEGQTKTKLGNTEIRSYVERIAQPGASRMARALLARGESNRREVRQRGAGRGRRRARRAS